MYKSNPQPIPLVITNLNFRNISYVFLNYSIYLHQLYKRKPEQHIQDHIFTDMKLFVIVGKFTISLQHEHHLISLNIS